jgi:hypothetical protein
MLSFLQKSAATPTPALMALAFGACAWIKAGPNALSYLLFLAALVAAFLYVRLNMTSPRS